jgi:hypothetical protein
MGRVGCGRAAGSGCCPGRSVEPVLSQRCSRPSPAAACAAPATAAPSPPPAQAPTSSAARTRTGPRRSRSNSDTRAPGGTVSREPSTARRPVSSSPYKVSHSRWFAASRTDATSRARRFAPDSSTRRSRCTVRRPCSGPFTRSVRLRGHRGGAARWCGADPFLRSAGTARRCPLAGQAALVRGREFSQGGQPAHEGGVQWDRADVPAGRHRQVAGLRSVPRELRLDQRGEFRGDQLPEQVLGEPASGTRVRCPRSSASVTDRKTVAMSSRTGLGASWWVATTVLSAFH